MCVDRQTPATIGFPPSKFRVSFLVLSGISGKYLGSSNEGHMAQQFTALERRVAGAYALLLAKMAEFSAHVTADNNGVAELHSH